MSRILDIALKDLIQIIRDRKVFMFTLIMPVVFTFLFGYAFGGFGGSADSRLPVGFVDHDGSKISQELRRTLEQSEVLQLEILTGGEVQALERRVAKDEWAAALIVPSGYGEALLEGHLDRIIIIGDVSTTSGMSVESEVLRTILRLNGAARTALILEEAAGARAPFDYTFKLTLESWEKPPIEIKRTDSPAFQQKSAANQQLAHTSPGMMLQFSIAALLTSAQVLVAERKNHALQRLFTANLPRSFILIGHYLAILTIIAVQYLTMLTFAQFFLGVDYLKEPLAVLMVAFCSALCIAALGLLIGCLAKTDEQAVVFALVPMFLLAGLGGTWVPLEVTSSVFRTIGHLSPVAWAMDGFKNFSVRGLGLNAAILPCAALTGYAILFFSLASWRFLKLE